MMLHPYNLPGNIIFNNPGAPTVLIHADHKRRDAASALLIGYYLSDLGYNTVIGSRLTSRMLYYYFRPEVVLTTHPDAIFQPGRLEVEAKHCKFVHMHPESSAMVRKSMIPHMRGGPEEIGNAYTKHISKVFTWGPLLKDWVVEEKFYSEEQVNVVGCVRYDFYRGCKRVERWQQTLGGMPSFSGISTYDKSNRFSNINDARNSPGIHYGIKGGFEDYLWAAAAYIRLFLEFLDVWCLELKRPIAFRPYTLENIRDYDFFRKRYGGQFSIDVNTPFPKWLLQRYASIFCYSSSIIESVISGVPYITFQEILGERLEYHQPRSEMPDVRGDIYKYTYQPESMDELVHLATQAREGRLPLRTSLEQSSSLRKMLWDYYGWPQEKPSAQIVAEEIHKIMQENGKNNIIPRIRFLREIASYCKQVGLTTRFGLWKTFNDYHFMPWHMQEKKYAYKEYQRLKEEEKINGL